MAMKKNLSEEIRSYLLITAGSVIMAIGIYFFKFPNNFSTGGVSSLSIILGRLYPHITQAENGLQQPFAVCGNMAF